MVVTQHDSRRVDRVRDLTAAAATRLILLTARASPAEGTISSDAVTTNRKSTGTAATSTGTRMMDDDKRVDLDADLRTRVVVGGQIDIDLASHQRQHQRHDHRHVECRRGRSLQSGHIDLWRHIAPRAHRPLHELGPTRAIAPSPQ